MRRQVLNAAESEEGDPVAARLRAQIAASPNDVSLRLRLASQYGKIGLRDLELEHLRLAVERFAESRDARWRLAEALRSAGIPQQAAEILSSFITANTAAASDPGLLNLLGICRDEAGDWKRGEEAFRRALAVAPDRADLQNNLGFNLLEQGKTREAIATLEQALRRNPASVVAQNNLGVALARSSAIDEAVRRFEKAGEDSATAYNNAAAALIEQNRYAEGRRLLQASLDHNPKTSAALANLKMVSELDGHPAEIRPRPPAAAGWRKPFAWLKRALGSPQPRQQAAGAGT